MERSFPHPLLRLHRLSVAYGSGKGGCSEIMAVQPTNLSMEAGEVLVLIGESGSGKSTVALSIGGLLPTEAKISGQIFFKNINLLSLDEGSLCHYRGSKICYIFQEPMACFNPILRLGKQLLEVVRLHRPQLSSGEAEGEIFKLLRELLFPDPRRVYEAYPHELSGGMLQRMMVAMALCNSPQLVIADEPTTALDSTSQKTVISLLLRLQSRLGFALLFITHNLGLARHLGHRIAVMCNGEIVECAAPEVLFSAPVHRHTQQLIHSLPRQLHGLR